MPFISVTPKPHRCIKPNTAFLKLFGNAGPGTVWQCEICSTRWLLQEHRLDGTYYWVEMPITAVELLDRVSSKETVSEPGEG